MKQDYVLVKKQTVKDGKKYYGIYLLITSLNKYVRVLTFKDDKRGYSLLDAVAKYIGDDDINKYFASDENE